MTGDAGYSIINHIISEGRVPSTIFCINDPIEMGEIGASVLHHMITGDDIHYPRRIQLPCQLKIRNSCK